MLNASECLELIRSRHSVRHYTDQKISREDLELITEAAIYAPSAMNRQSWQFTVLTDRDKIAELAEAIRVCLGRDTYDMYRPTALIIASNERDNRNGPEDCACALENMFLMAHALGIGSVWINQLKGICDEPEIRKILRTLEIPEDHLVWGMAALGHTAGHPRVTEKNRGVIRFHEV